MRQYISHHKGLITALGILFLYLSPLYILGENAHVRIHDNIDSNIGWYKLLADNGQIFGPINDLVRNMMNGLPRVAFGSEFNVNLWLYAVFKPFTSYTINAILMRLTAFVGMYLLLKRHFVKEKNFHFIVVGVALTFALLPYWPSGGLSIAGQPLMFYAFLNIRAGKSAFTDWLILILVPFYSNLIYCCFLLASMALWMVFDWLRTKKLNIKFLSAISLMSLMYLMIDYRLLYYIIWPDFISFRAEFFSGHQDLGRTFKLSVKNFLIGHGHVMTAHIFLVLPVIIMALVIAFINKQKARLLLTLCLINGVLSVWYALWYWEGMRVLKERFLIFKTFNFSRFHFLHPLFWYIAFAVALVIIAKKVKLGREICIMALCIQLVILFFHNDEIVYRAIGNPSYKQFYAEGLFQEIKQYIGENPAEYRTVSIGLHPIIAQYNGFYTLDFYNNIYPLTYKHQFRNIISGEFAKNKRIRKYYDRWGARCYVFAAELGKKYLYTKNSHKEIKNLQLNSAMLAQMGGKYVLSAVKITNNRQNQLTFLRTFEHKDFAWKIYLYKVM